MVLEEMDGLRVRGGISEEGEGGAAEGGDEAEEITIGGTGTDMVVMSEAIVLLYPALFAFSFCSLSFLISPVCAPCSISRPRKGARK